MVEEKAIIDLLSQYKEIVDPHSRCKLPELYDLSHYDLAVSAEQGNVSSLRSIAITLLKGDGIYKDLENAKQLFYRLHNNSRLEKDLVSKFYYSRILCVQKECSKGVSLNEELLEEGYAPAFALRGNLYEHGLCGFDVSMKKAKEHYLKAYQKKHIPGSFLLAKMLIKKGSLIERVQSIFFFFNAFCFSIFLRNTGVSSEFDTY